MQIPNDNGFRTGTHTEKVKLPKEKGKKPSSYKPKKPKIRIPKRK